ncbi:MAG: LysR family transcriptional regulator [Lachnospiraceae bacterium]|nr:LysR family transcriptional regulator [Lachnospiraceae bacterium]
MDIELHNKYVICVQEEGNLTRAAKKIGISQPALSIAIGNLEKKLGYKIFDKSTTPFKLTEEGKIYLEYLHKHQLAIKDYQQKITEFHDDSVGNVIIGAPVVYVESIVTKAIATLREKYPKYQITIKNAPVPELITMTKNGEADCFISTIGDLPETFEKDLIKEEKIYMCIPKEWEINEKLKNYQTNPGKTNSCFDYSLLQNMEFIFLEEDQPLQKEMRSFLAQNNITVQNHIVVNQVSSGVAMTALGAGISFAQEEMLKDSRYLKDICIYALPETIFDRKIYVTYDTKRFLSRACRNLIDVLKNKEKEV